jgi:hypothetical protein
MAKANREERGEVPVSPGIHRAAERAGLTCEEHRDSQRVTLLRGDLDLVVSEIKTAFDDVLETQFFMDDSPAERDSLVLNALRRLRNAETVIGAPREVRCDNANSPRRVAVPR